MGHGTNDTLTQLAASEHIPRVSLICRDVTRAASCDTPRVAAVTRVAAASVTVREAAVWCEAAVVTVSPGDRARDEPPSPCVGTHRVVPGQCHQCAAHVTERL